MNRKFHISKNSQEMYSVEFDHGTIIILPKNLISLGAVLDGSTSPLMVALSITYNQLSILAICGVDGRFRDIAKKTCEVLQVSIENLYVLQGLRFVEKTGNPAFGKITEEILAVLNYLEVKVILCQYL